MLDSEDVGVLGKAVVAALEENISSDPVVKRLRTYVDVHPSLGKANITNESLVRYFLSRNEDLERTKKALSRFLKWRADEHVDDVYDSVITNSPDRDTVTVSGACTKNRPCVWVYVNRHNKDAQTASQMKTFIACKIEEALRAGQKLREDFTEQRAAEALEETLSGTTKSAAAQAVVEAGHAAKHIIGTDMHSTEQGLNSSLYRNIDTFTLIFDLCDFDLLKNMNYDAISTLVNLCTYQYTNVVERVVIINAPWLFNACWGIIKNVIPDSARELVGFASCVEDLCVYVPAAHIPRDVVFSAFSA